MGGGTRLTARCPSAPAGNESNEKKSGRCVSLCGICHTYILINQLPLCPGGGGVGGGGEFDFLLPLLAPVLKDPSRRCNLNLGGADLRTSTSHLNCSYGSKKARDGGPDGGGKGEGRGWWGSGQHVRGVFSFFNIL